MTVSHESQNEISAIDVLLHFERTFKSTYGKEFDSNFSYKADISFIEKNVLSKYNPEDIFEIIDILFDVYPKEWANDAYPYVTIWQISGWPGDRCFEILEKKRIQQRKEIERAKQIEIDSIRYGYTTEQWERLLSLM